MLLHATYIVDFNTEAEQRPRYRMAPPLLKLTTTTTATTKETTTGRIVYCTSIFYVYFSDCAALREINSLID